jgi:RND family efflux transporter MFP subunit
MSAITQRKTILAAVIMLPLGLVLVLLMQAPQPQADESPAAPLLTVVTTHARSEQLPLQVPATGNVHAWQEASIGAESDGLTLIEVLVDVGDKVKRGQLLARFNSDIIAAELEEARASVAQATAAAEEAELNFSRAKTLAMSRAISTQQLDQTRIASMTARAQLDAARAFEKKQRLRLEQTRVHAPSDGIISARSATIGTVVPSAQELFRLIENGRLEWRAQVSMSDIEKLAEGQNAVITNQQQAAIKGSLRRLAPTIDTNTHSGLVYIDLPANTHLRAGTFLRGYIEVGDTTSLTLPQSAVILRDGFHYVMQVGAQSVVSLKKIVIGRQVNDRVEIITGLSPAESVITSGLSFLNAGDKVRVVDNPLPVTASIEEQ